ncbi:ABC transporter permease [Oceanomicrobium pacificus]|uniref:ABC transporter permease subunit n=1 Tax=Oceanomicrobium pacificus TaxID=2692916 RepID=A0A6B0TPF3_9RHOB|nr:ABC transporter permease [Oceanomicrobium pacificus]MXU66457.1 ABC transporter permease subunit [Oceanomicrobium pacificus]
MTGFGETLGQALWLILSGDADLWAIILLSLRVSLTALAIATLIGLPLGAALAVGRFPGRRTVITIVSAMMGLPPVVVGLAVYLMLSASGPFGIFDLLYTPAAMIIAQVVLVTPIVAALSRQVIADLHTDLAEQLDSFGLRPLARIPTLLWEGRTSLMTVVLAGFGRAIAEVGAVIIVGGNINHVTRVMTTAIALETSKGNLTLALALGTVLITMAIAINALVGVLGARARSGVPAHA